MYKRERWIVNIEDFFQEFFALMHSKCINLENVNLDAKKLYEMDWQIKIDWFTIAAVDRHWY